MVTLAGPDPDLQSNQVEPDVTKSLRQSRTLLHDRVGNLRLGGDEPDCDAPGFLGQVYVQGAELRRVESESDGRPTVLVGPPNQSRKLLGNQSPSLTAVRRGVPGFRWVLRCKR